MSQHIVATLIIMHWPMLALYACLGDHPISVQLVSLRSASTLAWFDLVPGGMKARDEVPYSLTTLS